MKISLLAAVAATALVAATNAVLAQSATPGHPARSPDAQMNAPEGTQTPPTRKRSTTGQATGQTQPTKAGPAKSGAAPQQTPAEDSLQPGGYSAGLTDEQKSKIRSTVFTSNAPRVTNAKFPLNIGTVVPRSVRLTAVPAPLVEIHPAWRDHMYFVVKNELVIVDPETKKIVAVVNV
jgi:hypothetical protein